MKKIIEDTNDACKKDAIHSKYVPAEAAKIITVSSTDPIYMYWLYGPR